MNDKIYRKNVTIYIYIYILKIKLNIHEKKNYKIKDRLK